MEVEVVAVCKNGKVKNEWGTKEGNVGEDCRDLFLEKQLGKIRRSRLAEVDEGNVCICINNKSGEK